MEEVETTSSSPSTSASTIRGGEHKTLLNPSRGEEISQSRATVRKYLGSTLRITLSDHRIITGQFQCMDQHMNIILIGSTERREASPLNPGAGGWGAASVYTRSLGSVMIPGKHIIKAEVKD